MSNKGYLILAGVLALASQPINQSINQDKGRSSSPVLILS